MSYRFRAAGKRMGVIASGAALVCLLASCALSGKDESSGSGQPGDAAGEGQTPLSPAESYRAVLLEERDFISTDLRNKKIKLGDIKEAVMDEDDAAMAATEFAVIDLDDDGMQEIVLWLKINGVSDYGFAVLRYLEGEVYGYTLPYRSFMELKEDGTFSFSGGAADSGIGRLSFSEEEYTIDELYYSHSEYDFERGLLAVQCYLKGALCTKERYEDGMRRQEEKADAVWYDLTADNINSALSDY